MEADAGQRTPQLIERVPPEQVRLSTVRSQSAPLEPVLAPPLEPVLAPPLEPVRAPPLHVPALCRPVHGPRRVVPLPQPSAALMLLQQLSAALMPLQQQPAALVPQRRRIFLHIPMR